MCCSNSRYPNYVIYALNFITAASGIVLIVFGAIYTIDENNGVRAFVDFSFGPLVISIGVVLVLVPVGGCWAAYADNNCILTMYASMMVALFVLQLAFGVVAIDKSQNGDILTYIKRSLRDLFEKDDADSIRNFHDIETGFQCCGVTDYLDYIVAIDGYPASCCGGVSPCNNPYQTGCAAAFTDEIKDYILIIGAASVGFAVIELLAAIFTFMRIRYRDDYNIEASFCCCFR